MVEMARKEQWEWEPNNSRYLLYSHFDFGYAKVLRLSVSYSDATVWAKTLFLCGQKKANKQQQYELKAPEHFSHFRDNGAYFSVETMKNSAVLYELCANTHGI